MNRAVQHQGVAAISGGAKRVESIISSGVVIDGSSGYVGRFACTCEGGFITVMNAVVVCCGRDSREHVAVSMQPRQSASVHVRFITGATTGYSMRQREENGRGYLVRLLLSALGFEKSWELCDGKWPVHGFRFRREV